MPLTANTTQDLLSIISDSLSVADELTMKVDPVKADHYRTLVEHPDVLGKYHVVEKSDGYGVTHKLPTIETAHGKHSVSDLTESFENFHEAELSASEKHEHAPLPQYASRANIHAYSVDSSEANSLLHGLYHGDENKVTPNAHKLPHVRGLDEDFKDSGTTHEMHVYTGLRRSPFDHFSDGDHYVDVHHPAFLSTSTHFGRTIEFSKILDRASSEHSKMHGIKNPAELSQHYLKLHVPLGSKAMSIRDVSEHPNENEILIHRGYNIRIHSHPEHKTDGHVSHYIWNAELLDHSPSILPRKLDESVNESVEDHSAFPDSASYPESDRKVLRSYSSYSHPINNRLHRVYDDAYRPSDRTMDATVALDKSVYGESSKDSVLYSGLKLSPIHLFNSDNPVDYHHPAFLSTSIDPKVAEGFAKEDNYHKRGKLYSEQVESLKARHNLTDAEFDKPMRHVLRIEAPKGTIGVSLKGVSKLPEENEILLSHGHHFLIDPKSHHIERSENGSVVYWNSKITGRTDLLNQ